MCFEDLEQMFKQTDAVFAEMAGAAPIEEPTVPEGGDGLRCQLAYYTTAQRVSDEPLEALAFRCRTSLGW